MASEFFCPVIPYVVFACGETICPIDSVEHKYPAEILSILNKYNDQCGDKTMKTFSEFIKEGFAGYNSIGKSGEATKEAKAQFRKKAVSAIQASIVSVDKALKELEALKKGVLDMTDKDLSDIPYVEASDVPNPVVLALGGSKVIFDDKRSSTYNLQLKSGKVVGKGGRV